MADVSDKTEDRVAGLHRALDEALYQCAAHSRAEGEPHFRVAVEGVCPLRIVITLPGG